MNRFLVILLILLLTAKSKAQTTSDQKNINHQTQVWASVNSTIRLKGHWGMMADFHVRRTDFLENASFYFARVGAAYWLNDQTSAALGYANLLSAPSGNIKVWTTEHRIFQQLQYSSKMGKSTLLQRIRNEQRWREKVDSTGESVTGTYSFNNRVRYLLSFTIPFSNKPSVPSLVLADEILLQFGKEIVFNTFEQNRIFLGVKQQLSPAWSLDFGYMQVFQQKNNGSSYDLNHTLRLFFYCTLDLNKTRATSPLGGEE